MGIWKRLVKWSKEQDKKSRGKTLGETFGFGLDLVAEKKFSQQNPIVMFEINPDEEAIEQILEKAEKYGYELMNQSETRETAFGLQVGTKLRMIFKKKS